MKYRHSSKRLVIRPLQASDYAAWKDAYSTMHPQKNKWDSKNKDQKELTKKKFNEILRENDRSRKSEEYIDFAVFRKDTKELIGFVGIMNVIRSVTQSAFLGYRLFNRHWGEGFAEEAIHGVFQIAFKEIKIHRLTAGIEPDNKRSIRLAKKLGMRKEGLLKKVVFLRSDWRDLIQFAIDCEEVGIPWKGKAQQRIR
ncbi:MAG: GNAT family N-acetyltransferase [Bacteriovorax sp.]